MKHLYLLINFLVIIIPLIFSFHPKIKFYLHWKAAFAAIIITAILFIFWDVVFTNMQVWGFNEQYISGIYLMNLPLEEVLFFICIPYACLFTYYCIKKLFIKQELNEKTEKIICYSFGVILLAASLFWYGKLYTFWALLLLGLFLLIFGRLLKRRILQIFSSYILLLIPFFIVNGLLTGSGIKDEVVWYNNNENINFRILTIPVEDFFYSLLLFLVNVYLYEKLSLKTNAAKA
jgi:lycopene cyclase domain-containing protein